MHPRNSLRPGERLFALLLLAFAGFAFHEAYGISGFQGLTTGGVMPMLAAAVMMLSGVSILVDTLRRRSDGAAGLRATLGYLLPLRVVLFVGLLITYGALIPRLGFLAASGLLLFLTIWALWRKGPLWALAISGASVGAIYLLFRVVFQVVLPTGTLWQ